MTPLATHVSVFLRERLPLERRASERACDIYALALRLFFELAAKRLKSDLFGKIFSDHASPVRQRSFVGHADGQPGLANRRSRRLCR
jgi:hypothetical protein